MPFDSCRAFPGFIDTAHQLCHVRSWYNGRATCVAASQQVKKSKEGKIPKGFLVPSPNKNRAGWPKHLFASTGDSVGQFCRYQCSTLIKYDSNLSGNVWHFLDKIAPSPWYSCITANPKEKKDANLIIVTSNFRWFRTPIDIFCTNNWYNYGSVPQRALLHTYECVRVVPSRNFRWVWVRDGDEMMWRHIFSHFVTFQVRCDAARCRKSLF